MKQDKKVKSNTLPTVTLAVSAYNEAGNILNFLKSVFLQKEVGFRINKILVISDGSSDDTVKLARFFKSPKLIVKEYKERTGKSVRLNEIYSNLTSDFLVQFDADIIFSDPLLIKKMIMPFLKNKKLGMVGGNMLPRTAHTFTEKAAMCTTAAFLPLRNINNVLTVNGPILAFRNELVKKILVPEDMLSNDVYTYLCCITSGYEYAYEESAIVYYKLPTTLKDQIRQNTRVSAAPERLKKYFPASLVDREYRIPGRLLAKNQLKQFIKHPVLCSYIFIVNKYCSIKAYFRGKKIGAKWDMVYSTKKF